MSTLDIMRGRMKKTKIDSLGRVVIPIHFRKRLGIAVNSEINVDCFDGRIIITPQQVLCPICQSTPTVTDIGVCRSCAEKIINYYKS